MLSCDDLSISFLLGILINPIGLSFGPNLLWLSCVVGVLRELSILYLSAQTRHYRLCFWRKKPLDLSGFWLPEKEDSWIGFPRDRLRLAIWSFGQWWLSFGLLDTLKLNPERCCSDIIQIFFCIGKFWWFYHWWKLAGPNFGRFGNSKSRWF